MVCNRRKHLVSSEKTFRPRAYGARMSTSDVEPGDIRDSESHLFEGLEDALLHQAGDDLFGSGAGPIAAPKGGS